MPDLAEKLSAIGLTRSDVKYLKARGAGKTKSQAIWNKAEGSLRLNGPKGAKFYQRFVEKTGWDNETTHCRVGVWLNTGACPVDAALHPPTCPDCGGTDPESFCVYPFDQRCDQCFTEAVAAWEAAKKEAMARRTLLGAELARAMDDAGVEAARTGTLSIPSRDQIMSTVAEFAGGWNVITEILSEMLTAPKGRQDRFKIAMQLLDYLKERETESDNMTINVVGLTAEEVDRVIVDAVLSQWHRRKDQHMALTDILRQRGVSPPADNEDSVDEEPSA